MFLSHWDLTNRRIFRNSSDIEDEELDRYFELSDYKGVTSIAQFIDNSPISNQLIIKDNLLHLIFSAKKKIVISTPYFYPPKDLINALKYMSAIGVKVIIIVPKNPDLFNFFRTLNRQLFFTLLSQGIEIYEYFGFNHEKVLLIDDEFIYLGTYNWDYRALYLNFECSVLLQCKTTANKVCQFTDNQMKNSHRIFLQDITKKSKNLFNTGLAAIIRLFKP